MNSHLTEAFRDYKAGKEYNARIGLYSTVRQNERFYRGDQWYASDTDGTLPHPVFNLVRRVTDHLVSAVSTGSVCLSYECRTNGSGSEEENAARRHAIRVLGDEANTLWNMTRMERKLPDLLYEAAVAGDAAFYCRWDPDTNRDGNWAGSIETSLVHGSDLFVSDVSNPDLQEQDWVMIASRDTVAHLRNEAREAGLSPREVASILPDGTEGRDTASDYAAYLPDNTFATCLVRFWRENGAVWFRKSTATVDFPAVKTKQTLYPLAFFRWYGTRDSYHGTSPVTGLLPNQKYLNLAYALAMKHMQSTAFSKVVYDQSRIPEWTEEVGQAIAAVGGGNMADAASVIGVGQMQDGYLDLIARVEQSTKELMGATDSVLGSEEASNTSAILVLQEATRSSLGRIVANYGRFLEEIADIWRDLLVGYFAAGRPVPVPGGEGRAEYADFSCLRHLPVRAYAEVTGNGKYSAAESQNVLDLLLREGHITVTQYLERLPEGLLFGRETLLDEFTVQNADDENEKGEARV